MLDIKHLNELHKVTTCGTCSRQTNLLCSPRKTKVDFYNIECNEYTERELRVVGI